MPRRLWLVLAFLLTLGLLAGLWQWLALKEVITVAVLEDWLRWVTALGDSRWMPPLVLLGYVLASLVVFPLSVMVAATGLIFGAFMGSFYAVAGTLLAAAATYWIGRYMGRETVVRHGGRRLNALASALSARGVRTMVVISLLPLAPFTVTNMVAGAFHLRFRDYMLGTLIGILPGVLAMTVLGSQLASLVRAESPGGVVWTLGVIALALGVIAALRVAVARYRG